MNGHQGSLTDGNGNTIWTFRDGRVFLELVGEAPLHVADIIDGEYKLRKIIMHKGLYAVAFYSSTVIFLSPRIVSVTFPIFPRRKYWMPRKKWERVRLQQFKEMDFSHLCYVYVNDFRRDWI